MNSIPNRIEDEINIRELATLLAERLSPIDLQLLLMETYRQRANRRTPRQVLDEYAIRTYMQPSLASPQRLCDWETLAWSLLPEGFEAVTLSPVAPLGTCSVTAPVDQNRIVATLRNSEVVSNLTNVLALECALRRRDLMRVDPKSAQSVHLAASHRLLRPQQVSGRGIMSHFALFGLCSSGWDQGILYFEIATMTEHLRFYLFALTAFMVEGTRFQIDITDFAEEPRWDRLESELLVPLRGEFASVEFRLASERETGRDYYRDVCFHLYATLPTGERLFLADGGSVNWTQKYLGNGKERLIISSIDSERLCTIR